MPVQGLVRARKHQFGRQSVAGTAVAATRAYEYRGVPTPNLNWTHPEVDAGAIAPAVAPTREAPELTSPLTIPVLRYNHLPKLFAGIFGGNVSPTGGGVAKTWPFDPDVEDPDDRDLFTYEFGDNILTDWFQYVDSVVESIEITGPDGLGALTASVTWRHGSIRNTGSTDHPVDGTVPTPGLDIETSAITVYLKDGALFIADAFAGLGSTVGHGSQVVDALHNFVLRINATYDEKRWANGDQSFDVDEMAITGYTVSFEGTYGKSEEIVGTDSETDHWMKDDAFLRYLRMVFTSTANLQTGPDVPYSWVFTMPAFNMTRTDGEVGGNAVVTITADAVFDGTRFFPTTVVTSLTDAQLGTIGS